MATSEVQGRHGRRKGSNFLGYGRTAPAAHAHIFPRNRYSFPDAAVRRDWRAVATESRPGAPLMVAELDGALVGAEGSLVGTGCEPKASQPVRAYGSAVYSVGLSRPPALEEKGDRGADGAPPVTSCRRSGLLPGWEAVLRMRG